MLFLRVVAPDAMADDVVAHRPGATGALEVLLANVAMLLVAGTMTLAIQRRFGRAPTALAVAARPSERR